MYNIRYICLTVCLVGVVLSCQSDKYSSQSRNIDPPAILDSLQVVYAEISEAVYAGDRKQFIDQLDPAEVASMQQLVQRHGYTSLGSYFAAQFVNWPKLDTLTFWDIKESGDYARVTYSGGGSELWHREPNIRYTFMLFHRYNGKWRLAAMSELESPRHDMYGYEINYHETDLPPKLRFPRLN